MKWFLQVPSQSLTYLSASPAGFKSKEERQKEEIHQFWNSEYTQVSCVPYCLQCNCSHVYFFRYHHHHHISFSLTDYVVVCTCLTFSSLSTWPGPYPPSFSVYHSVCVCVCQVTLLSFKVESEYTFVDFIRGG